MPLYVRGPGIAAGRRIDTLVSNADLAPTFAGWAGARVPRNLDGRSLEPLLRGGSSPNRRLVGIASQTATPSVPAWRGVRTPTHTYVRYGTGEVELYDNVADPLQLRSLAGQRSSRALLEALEGRSVALATCAASRCGSLEDAPLR